MVHILQLLGNAQSMKKSIVYFQGREVSLSDLTAIFSEKQYNLIETEIGAGKGRYIINLAQRFPTNLYIAIENSFKFFSILTKRASKKNLQNLISVFSDASYFIHTFIPKIDVLHIYFPDPWPKERHSKRRILNVTNVNIFLSKLTLGGTLYFASDFIPYAESFIKVLKLFNVEIQLLDKWEDGLRTNYEIKYEKEKRTIIRLKAIKTSLTPETTCHFIKCAYLELYNKDYD